MDRPYGISDFAFPSRWDRESGPDLVEWAGQGSRADSGTWNQALDRCCKAHRCSNGLLPLRVARPKNAGIAPLSQVPFRFAPATGRALCS
jgi:hypothetical protein